MAGSCKYILICDRRRFESHRLGTNCFTKFTDLQSAARAPPKAEEDQGSRSVRILLRVMQLVSIDEWPFPAIVVWPRARPFGDRPIHIRFVSHYSAWIEETNIKNYTEFKDTLIKSSKTAAFKEAVNKIEEYISDPVVSAPHFTCLPCAVTR